MTVRQKLHPVPSTPETLPSGDTGSGGPLKDLLILDLSRILSGPFATMTLGDLGADVIKVEQPGHGDDTREWGPPFQGGEAAYFLSVNRNKRSLAVDLKSPEGLDVVRRLALKADISDGTRVRAGRLRRNSPSPQRDHERHRGA
jgi:formyl-CoA transferase/CoA:oxalate CoA-transferase